MIIEKIHLENWKNFRDPVEVEFSSGLNIVYGGNEKGKTTLMDSIRTIFFSKHNSKTAKIKSIIPWGTKLLPYGEIQFQHYNSNYRIKKRFNVFGGLSPESTIERLEDSDWVRIADADIADKEIINMIGGNLKGLDSKPQNWGLGQSLWMIQGKPSISEDLNNETINSLQNFIGTSIESDEEKTIINEISKRFLSIFTESKRDLRSKSDLRILKGKIEECEDIIKERERYNLKKDDLIVEIENKKMILEEETNKLDIANVEKIKLEEVVKDAKNHEKEREECTSEFESLERGYNSLKKEIDSFKEGKEKIDYYEQENVELKNDLDTYKQRLTEKQEEIDFGTDKLRKKENLSNEYSDKKTFASITRTIILEQEKLETKELRFEEVNNLFKSLRQKNEELESIQAPKKEELIKIENIYKEIHDTKTRLDALGLEINVTSQSTISGNIFLDGENNTFKLAEGSNKWNAHQYVLLQINDVAKIEIKSGSEDVKEMTDKLIELKREYDEYISVYDVNDIEGLKKLLDKKNGLKKEISILNEEYKSKEDKNDLLEEIKKLKNKIKFNWENKIPEDSPFRDCDKLDKSVALEKLSGMLNEMDKIQEDIQMDKEIVNSELETLNGEKETINKEIQALNTKIYGNKQSITEIKQILEKYEDFNLDEQENKLDELLVNMDRKSKVLKVFENEIKEKEEIPIKEYEKAEIKVNNLNEVVGIYKLDLASLEGELKLMISQVEDINKIEERLETLKKREKCLEAESSAIELLYDITQFYRDNTIVELSQPIQNQMDEFIEHLLGKKYSGINLSKSIKPTSVDIMGGSGEAELESLSFGTQEQIWCLFRLALGKFLSKEDRQLVVLDDPLVNTDYARLQRMLQVLDECARNLQIIIVTCDIDKYNGLNANLIPLETKFGIKQEKIDLNMVP